MPSTPEVTLNLDLSRDKTIQVYDKNGSLTVWPITYCPVPLARSAKTAILKDYIATASTLTPSLRHKHPVHAWGLINFLVVDSDGGIIFTEYDSD